MSEASMYTRWQLRQLQISEISKWSNLAKIGRSNLVKLTIIAPFFGYMIIFNSSISEYLRIAVEKFQNSNESPAIEVANYGSLGYLYYVYFGLICLGIASFLFTVFCPEEINNTPDASAFVIEREKVLSPILLRSSVFRFLNIVHRHYRREDILSFSVKELGEYPNQVNSRVEDFIQKVERQSDFSNFEVIDDFMQNIRTGSGYTNVEAVVDIIVNQRAVHRGVNIEFMSAIEKMPRDVFHLEHEILNYSKINIRISIILLYMTGFLILFIPTLKNMLYVMAIIVTSLAVSVQGDVQALIVWWNL